MPRSTSRAARVLVALMLGAVAGAACLTVAWNRHPGIAFEMDRDLPRITAGFYEPERSDETTYAWMGRRGQLALMDLDRRVPWTCTVRFRSGRTDPQAPPTVTLSLDDQHSSSAVATNDFRDLSVTAAPRPDSNSLRVQILSSSVFVPSFADRRELAVQVDRLSCVAAGHSLVWPPRAALKGAVAASAAFAAAFTLVGASIAAATTATFAIALAQAVPLTTVPGPFTSYAETVPWLASWIAIAATIAVFALEALTRRPLTAAARFVIAFSAAVLYLKLVMLLHPAKPVVDAVFQAHRLEWVMEGRYFFTQLMPDGVRFPYAIGLYVFSAPWSVLTRDHVALLRIVVCVVEAVAGAILYTFVVRERGERLAGAIAVVLFHLVPLPYEVLGNANLTNAFGQCIALIALIAAASLPGSSRAAAGVMTLLALALLSHVSSAALVSVSTAALVLLFYLAPGRTLRRPAAWLFVSLSAALVLSFALYYRHFPEVYEDLRRVRTGTSVEDAMPAADDATRGGSTVEPAGMPGPTRVHRTGTALRLTVDAVGWPTFVLAIAGLIVIGVRRTSDRFLLALGAWAIAYAVFVTFVVLSPVRAEFERYAVEFVGRVAYATYPAVVLLAGFGASWGLRRRWMLRVAVVVLLAAALWIGAGRWANWLA